MRPVMLDLHGFASFREPARVDFRGADFFALIGPTGSGKSTVIDAMAFALYGSVPRWGRKGMVSLALAPTVDRGTVKLVFEVGRDRYVAARELRRTGGRVSQRAASLERLVSPDGLALPGEKTVPLAKDVDGVTEAVARLLGLSYEDFTQCVVLPQGDFQKFLHAKPGDRQEILLRLLGAENYKQMMTRANQRATSAEQRAATITETLRGYDDATDEALAEALAAEAALGELAVNVAAAVPEISSARSALEAASGRLETLRAEHALLSGLQVPSDAADTDRSLAAAREALAELRDAERAAEDADTAARDALSASPPRAPLERARQQRADRTRLLSSVPGLQTRAGELSARAQEAVAAVGTAERALEEARDRRDAAARDAESAAGRVRQISDEQAALREVSVPGGITALDESVAAARAALSEAEGALEIAERAEADASQARAAAVPQAALAQAAKDLGQIRDLLGGMADLRQAAADARDRQASADKAVSDAEEELRRRQDALERLRRAHVIAGLRPHLAAGQACPLCEQTVQTLPAPAPDGLAEGKAARAAADAAEAAVARARSAAQASSITAARADTAVETALSRGEELLAALAEALAGPLRDAGLPLTRQLADTGRAGGRLAQDAVDPGTAARACDEAAAALEDRERVERTAEQAAKTANAARTRHREAQAKHGQADTDLNEARQALRAARDPLVRFGAPQPDPAVPLARSWADLASWASGQAAERAAALAEAQQATRRADAEHAGKKKDFAAAEQALTRAREQAAAAAADEQRARSDLANATERITELDGLLAEAPADEEIAGQLATADRLEREAAEAAKALREARSARADGETELAGRERAAQQARAKLSAARDRVVSLGAPALPDAGSLLGGWTALVTWSAEQLLVRERGIEQAAADADKHRGDVEARTARLAEDLAAAGIAAEPDRAAGGAGVAGGAEAAVAAERERARAEVKRVAERQAEAARLLARQTEAQEEQQVAKLLGDLLRANAFQRWLVGAALDDLVTHASATLSALSSGQFDLAYDDGDFYVIDHADADTRRSVRTLSGGETFQASLALALALSSQISALAAAGAARLDSIFLDEGFGTLDPETLDVVATTLETLAQGDRMVGVVTHVGALAERVPVRFRVTRDTRTSTVTREGIDLTTMEELA